MAAAEGGSTGRGVRAKTVASRLPTNLRSINNFYVLAELGNQSGGKLTLEAFLAINDFKLRNRRSLLDRKAIDDRKTF